MKWIWSFEELLKIIEKKKTKPDILHWALNRLGVLYPDQAAPVLAAFCHHEHEPITLDVAQFFHHHPETAEPYLDTLTEAFKISGGQLSGILASILAKHNKSDFITHFISKYENDDILDYIGFEADLFQLSKIDSPKARGIIKSYLTKITDDPEKWTPHCPGILEALLDSADNADVVEELLRHFIDHPSLHPLHIELFTSIASYCDEWFEESFFDTENDSDDEDTYGKDMFNSYLAETLDAIYQTGHAPGISLQILQKLIVKEYYEKIITILAKKLIELLETKKQEADEESYSLWKKNTGKPRESIESILAIHSLLDSMPNEWHRSAAFSVLFFFAGVVELEDLIGMPVEKLAPDQALVQFLKVRPTIKDDAALSDCLRKSNDLKKIVPKVIQTIEDNIDSVSVDRLVKFVADLKDNDAMFELMALDDHAHFLWENISTAINNMGTRAQQLDIPFMFECMEPEEAVYHPLLPMLSNFPTEKSVDFVLDNWERLMDENKDQLLEMVFHIGDRRFINLLKDEYYEGDTALGHVFLQLCQFNGVKSPLQKKIETDIKRADKSLQTRIKYLQEGQYKKLLKLPVHLDLHCRKCHRTYCYEIPKLVYFPATTEIHVAEPIACKNCGTVDHYQYAPNSIKNLEAHFTAMGLLMENNQEPSPEERIHFTILVGEPDIIDGDPISIEEKVEYFSEKLSRDPKNVEYTLHLASSLHLSKRSEDAAPLMESLLNMSPPSPDAYLWLGTRAISNGKLQKAYELYTELYQLLAFGPNNLFFLEDTREEFEIIFSNNFLSLGLRLKKRLPKELEEWLLDRTEED
jgi:tetratricopeptide (TPR) repeat protein